MRGRRARDPSGTPMLSSSIPTPTPSFSRPSSRSRPLALSPSGERDSSFPYFTARASKASPASPSAASQGHVRRTRRHPGSSSTAPQSPPRLSWARLSAPRATSLSDPHPHPYRHHRSRCQGQAYLYFLPDATATASAPAAHSDSQTDHHSPPPPPRHRHPHPHRHRSQRTTPSGTHCPPHPHPHPRQSAHSAQTQATYSQSQRAETPRPSRTSRALPQHCRPCSLRPQLLFSSDAILAQDWQKQVVSTKWTGMILKALRRGIQMELHLPAAPAFHAPSVIPFLTIIRPSDVSLLSPAPTTPPEQDWQSQIGSSSGRSGILRRPNTAPTVVSNASSPNGSCITRSTSRTTTTTNGGSGTVDLARVVMVSLVQVVYSTTPNVNDLPVRKRLIMSVAQEVEEVDLGDVRNRARRST